MIDAVRDAILDYTSTRESIDGVYRTEIASLSLIRGNKVTVLEHAFYEPALIVVVQGSKELMLGDARFTYGAGEYLVIRVGMPVLASITDASDARPYLAIAITIDFRLITDLLDQLGGLADSRPTPLRLGLFVGKLDVRQADAIARLTSMLATPDALRVLYPSIAREIFYWTLIGSDGVNVRRLATANTHTQRIAEAIDMMRAEFSESVSVERLASIANMSPSSFHQHFKAITSMSPLQYHKQLRLLEARRLMLTDGADATRAAYQVGYQSASQFNREYARMFGAPPRRHIVGSRPAASS